ncbi:MAG TPA: PEP-CTERM sorting domain-containing protein [Stellaceae bacterium]|nr:PEP-CTERM sorting domain-containing protein [Stellaceae bacterium]
MLNAATPRTLRRTVGAAALGLAALLALAAPAHADVLTVGGGDNGPNAITDPSQISLETMTYTSYPNVLVIVGVYNNNNSPQQPTVDYDGNPLSLASAGLLGLGSTDPVAFTSLSSPSCNQTPATVFCALGSGTGGLGGAGPTLTYEGLAGATGALSTFGIAAPADGFELYAFDLDLPDDEGVSPTPLDISVDGAPDGSFVVAFSCQTRSSDSNSCPGEMEQTNLDGAGVIVAPEPASLTLFGTALAGLFAAKRRRRRSV